MQLVSALSRHRLVQGSRLLYFVQTLDLRNRALTHSQLPNWPAMGKTKVRAQLMKQTGRPYRRSTPAAAAQQSAPALSPAQLRADDRLKVSYHIFKVVGVTFEDRPSQIKKLEVGNPVMLIHEPENIYDPNAVAVKRLNGIRLGYVAAEENRRKAFARWVDFGAIREIKCYDDVPKGIVVEMQPTLPPLVAEAIPPQFRALCVNFVSQLDEDDQNRLQKLILKQSQGRCQISGSTAESLEVCPVWHVDDMTLQIQLEGFHAIARSLWHAQQKLLAEKSVDKETAATFCDINGWKPLDVKHYRTHQLKLLKERQDLEWTLVVEHVLSSFGIDVPKHITKLTTPQ